MFEYSLCNELLAADGLSLDAQCEVAAELGYCGLELAPATLAAQPHKLSAREVDEARSTIEAHGLRVTGLHWLLSAYPDLSITDPERRAVTQEVLGRLIEICADLGGEVLVHGSPGQRQKPPGLEVADLHSVLAEFFRPLAERAGDRGITYCIEPLSSSETGVINTVAEGVQLAELVGHPAFATMIDTSAAGQTEPPVAALIGQWAASPLVRHLHLNDTNRGAPGMGNDPFVEIVSAILGSKWTAPLTIEPFRTLVDAKVTAAIGIATLRACEERVRGS